MMDDPDETSHATAPPILFGSHHRFIFPPRTSSTPGFRRVSDVPNIEVSRREFSLIILKKFQLSNFE